MVNMRWLSKRRSIRGILLREVRRLFILLLGTVVFLLLVTTFGESRTRLVLSTREDNFPRKIWQTWRVDPLRFDERDSERARSWIVKNPSLRYEVLTDANALAYVEQVFGPSGLNRPDVVHTYASLSAKIIQADLLRYIIMYVEGGIYSDIDVEALRSLEHFVPSRLAEKDLDMIIGVETDEPDFVTHPILGSKAQSFCQWVFVCKPRLPVMIRLIDNILIWLDKLAVKQQRIISQLEFDFDEVLNGTGPSAFTAAVLQEMSASTGKRVTWNDFHNLEEAKVVGRTLVHTSEAFAAGTGHSDSGVHRGKGALVQHHFHASQWTKSHPRYKHPIYGPVEKCNWNKECVRLWDANTAFFASLPQQEQMKMIALKDLDRSDIAGIDG